MADAYELSEDEAKIVARALIHYNNHLVGEFTKIHQTEGVSELIVEAARDNYNNLTKEGSELHVKLAQHFSALRAS